MQLCFCLLNPPKPLDGPVDPAVWRRLARALSALLLLYGAMALLSSH